MFPKWWWGGGGGEASKAAFNSGSEPKARLPVTTILNYPLSIGTARWRTSDVIPFLKKVYLSILKNQVNKLGLP